MPISGLNIIGGGLSISNVTDPLVLTGTTLSVKDATDTQKGVSQLQVDINDVISITKGVTPKYVKDLIDNSLLNPNNLANVDYGCLLPIALTGSVTYQGTIIPTNKRVAAMGQVNQNTNGIYISNDSGAWVRATDADTVLELFSAQFTTLNGDKGRFLCTISKTAILPTPINFIQLYQINDGLIGVQIYNSTKVYNMNDLVVNPSINEFIYRCLIDGTNNIIPSMASPNWEIYQGLIYQDSAVIAPNGNDNKSPGFPYLTYNGAITDMPINSYIEGKVIVNTETITPKTGMKIKGNKAQINNIIVTANNLDIDGLIFANTIGTANPIEITGSNSSKFTNCKAIKNTGNYSISMSGLWDGLHKFSGLELVGNVNLVGGAATGIAYFENIFDVITINVNINSGTKVYISNCPNLTVNNTNGNVIRLDNHVSIGDYKYSQQASDHNGWTKWTNGRVLNRTTYANLFALVTANNYITAGLYGAGDGSTTFTLSNAQDKVMGIAGSSHVIGSATGSETFTLTNTQLPSHTHTFTGNALANHTHGITDPQHSHGMSPAGHWYFSGTSGRIQNFYTGGYFPAEAPGSISSAATGISLVSSSAGTPSGTNTGSSAGIPSGTNSSTGTGSAFNIMQPTFFGSNLFIYTGV